MVIPSLGYYFIAIDYSAIELRTLAAVCQRRYGSSKLGDVIKQGIDPHAFTASMVKANSRFGVPQQSCRNLAAM